MIRKNGNVDICEYWTKTDLSKQHTLLVWSCHDSETTYSFSLSHRTFCYALTVPLEYGDFVKKTKTNHMEVWTGKDKSNWWRVCANWIAYVNEECFHSCSLYTFMRQLIESFHKVQIAPTTRNKVLWRRLGSQATQRSTIILILFQSRSQQPRHSVMRSRNLKHTTYYPPVGSWS